MAIFTGANGTVVFDGDTQVNVRNWSFTGTVDTLEVTDLGDRERSYIPGLKSGTANATIMYHDDNNTLRNMLNNTITTGTPAPARLQLRFSDRDIDFDAYLTSVNVTCAVGDVMTADCSFQMTGDYTELNL